MGYVVVVFCIINIAALAGVAYILWSLDRFLPQSVELAIQAEVRKQDDRIEKRLAKVQGNTAEGNGTDVSQSPLVAGRSHRRR